MAIVYGVRTFRPTAAGAESTGQVITIGQVLGGVPSFEEKQI